MLGPALPRQHIAEVFSLFLHLFLQDRLGVIKERLVLQIQQHKTTDKRPRLLKTAVQIDGADQRLHHIRNNGIPRPSAGHLLALSQQNIMVQPQIPGTGRERGLAHHRRPSSGKLSLRHLLMAVIEKFAGDHLQHRIP